MAKAHTATPVYPRGSAVLDYWLAHPEGMTIRPLNARVERAVGPVPFGPADALVVRRPNGRERFIPAETVVAVDPVSEELFLEEPSSGDPVHERAVRTAAAVGRVARSGARVTGRGIGWLVPRLVRYSRVGATHGWRATAAGARWVAPRAAREARLIGRGCRRGSLAAIAAGRRAAARYKARRAVSGDSPQTGP